MKRRAIVPVCVVTVLASVMLGLLASQSNPTWAAPASHDDVEIRYLSPLAVIADKTGKTLYVAEATGHQVGVVDVAARTVARNLPLPGEAMGVALSPDGKRLWALFAFACCKSTIPRTLRFKSQLGSSVSALLITNTTRLPRSTTSSSCTNC